MLNRKSPGGTARSKFSKKSASDQITLTLLNLKSPDGLIKSKFIKKSASAKKLKQESLCDTSEKSEKLSIKKVRFSDVNLESNVPSTPETKILKSALKRKTFNEEILSEEQEFKNETTTEVSVKKNLKRKSTEDAQGASVNKQPKLFQMKKKERRNVRRQQDNKRHETGKILKSLWEEFRQEDCKPEKKKQLLNQACSLLKGHVKEFAFAHDTVRVLECILACGTTEHRTLLYEELKGEIILMSKCKYSKFFVLKMLKYGTKFQKDEIIKSFYGNVIKLISHTEAAEVVEFAFNESASSSQRSELVQEFYGPSFKFFKDAELKSLQELFEKQPQEKSKVLKNMLDTLLRVLQKSVVRHSIVHYILLQFVTHCDADAKSQLTESIHTIVPEILHTKDGSRVAMQCIWHGTAKDRKVIVKSMKPFVKKIAMEEYGHMVLLALFDCVDDTKLVDKIIIKELKQNLVELSENVYARKVLVYLMSPRDTNFFSPTIIEILKGGDNNVTSKKETEIRRAELKSAVEDTLLQLLQSQIKPHYKDNAFCQFALVILNSAGDNKVEAFRSLVEVVCEKYTCSTENVHPVEHQGYHYLLKKLIIQDKNRNTEANVSFSQLLVETVPKDVMKSWIECNRGTFLLVWLYETGIPFVVERIKEEMLDVKDKLADHSFKGAEILLKKLNE